nr:unnamed protein product [Callosobruchus chinensis]
MQSRKEQFDSSATRP